MDILNNDILNYIIDILDYKTIIKLAITSKQIKYFIKDYYIYDTNNIVPNYELLQIIFKYFSNIKKINICNINVSDNDFEYFKNTHSLNMSGCLNISNNCFKYLTNIDTLIMYRCNQEIITDDAFKNLPNLRILNISSCNQITDNAFKYFNNIYVLIMSSCDQLTITDDAFINLHNIYTLDISFCNQLTNNTFKHLNKTNIKYIYIYGCNLIISS